VKLAGHAVFFPAAALYAVIVLPASVLAMTGETGAMPALSTPLGHAHEMLFGYALGVVAGNQLGPMPLPRIALLAGLWALARVAFVAAPQSFASAALNIAFAVLLAAHIAPRLIRAAKKWRNQSLPLVLVEASAVDAGGAVGVAGAVVVAAPVVAAVVVVVAAGAAAELPLSAEAAVNPAAASSAAAIPIARRRLTVGPPSAPGSACWS